VHVTPNRRQPREEHLVKKPNPGAAKALGAQAADTQALVKSMPDNSNKAREIGRANAVSPPVGLTRKPASRAVGASTLSESNPSAKTGGGKPSAAGKAAPGSLDHARSDAADQVLTTNQGVPIGDTR
jgi:catalase